MYIEANVLGELSSIIKCENFKEFTPIYHHGSLPQALYVILKGSVRSYAHKMNFNTKLYIKKLNLEKQSSTLGFKGLKEKRYAKVNSGAFEADLFKKFNMDRKYFSHKNFVFHRTKDYAPGEYLSELYMVYNVAMQETMVTLSEVEMLTIDKKDFKIFFNSLCATNITLKLCYKKVFSSMI